MVYCMCIRSQLRVTLWKRNLSFRILSLWNFWLLWWTLTRPLPQTRMCVKRKKQYDSVCFLDRSEILADLKACGYVNKFDIALTGIIYFETLNQPEDLITIQ